MENSFYITTHSKKSNFEVKLSREFLLDDSWTVGLADISIPKTWHNILEDQELELLVYNPLKDAYIEVIKNIWKNKINLYIKKQDEELKEWLEKL